MNNTDAGTAESQFPGGAFVTPPKHVNFKAKKLFGEIPGKIRDGAVAIVDLNGGGPEGMHSHPHNHLFIVTSGEARVEYEDETVIIHENEAFVVEGSRPHAVWNNLDGRTVMIGIIFRNVSYLRLPSKKRGYGCRCFMTCFILTKDYKQP